MASLKAALIVGMLSAGLWHASANFGFQRVARTRVASGALALLGAVAYLGIALWSVPVETKTRAVMERQLQIGEVAWLREQVKQ